MHFSSYWFVFVNKLGQGKSGFADNCCKIDGKYGLSSKNNSNEQIIWRLINWRNWSWLNPQWFGLECYAAVFVQIIFMVETGRNWAQQVLFIFCITGLPWGHKDGQCDARKWPFGRLHNGSIITRPIIRACPPKYAKLTRVWFALASNGKSHGAIEFSKVSWLSDLGFGERRNPRNIFNKGKTKWL